MKEKREKLDLFHPTSCSREKIEILGTSLYPVVVVVVHLFQLDIYIANNIYDIYNIYNICNIYNVYKVNPILVVVLL